MLTSTDKILLGLFGFLVAWTVFTRLVEYNLPFWPSRNIQWKPEDIGEETMIDGTIHSWYQAPNEPDGAVIMFCHGTNGNIGDRKYVYDLARNSGAGILLFDYSGYGKSLGQPSAANILRDGQHAYDWLASRVEPHRIVIWGESLGGAVASWIASRNACRCLILFSTFTSLADLSNGSIPVAFRLAMASLVATNSNLATKELMHMITCPLLIVHSEDDDLIPFSHGKELFRRAVNSPYKKFFKIRGTHTKPRVPENVFNEVIYFSHLKTNDSIRDCMKEHKHLIDICDPETLTSSHQDD